MLAFDLKDAIRGLRRDRLYSAITILTLALALGATTAVFSIVHGVLLKPLPYPEPDRLVSVREVWREFANRYPSVEANERHFEYWRTRTRAFESMAQYIELPANATGSGEAAQISLVHASSSLFDVLGVKPALGRLLIADDERSGAPAVVILADKLWTQRFGSDRGIVGRSIQLDGASFVVIGVTPPGLRLPETGGLSAQVDAFVPIRVEDDNVGWVGEHNNAVVARLKHDVTLEQAHAELDVLQAEVSRTASERAHQPVTLSSTVTPLADTIVGKAQRGLILLLAAILVVLLIACSNLANLSLTRTSAQMRETAIRTALGASRGRLIGRAVMEQLLLATAGGAIGLWVAWAAIALFVRTAPIDLPRVSDVALDGRVLAFGAAVSVISALLIAFLPAWRLGGRDVQRALRSTGGTMTSDRHGVQARSMLLTTQVALSVTLLIVTGLLIASFLRLMSVDKGFVPDGVLTVGVTLPANRYAEEPVRRAAYDRLLASLGELPGVRSAAMTSMMPLSGQSGVNFVVSEGPERPLSELPTANFRFVAPDYFATLGIRLVGGRPFTDSERASDRPAPAVISASMAARLWPGESALGRRFSRGNKGEQGFAVVGIAADSRTTSLDSTPPLMVYAPYWWRSRAAASLLIRTGMDPASLIPSVRRVVRAVDPDIAVGESRPLAAVVDDALAARRYQMQLFVAFGLMALVIATLGVYAVTAYGVSRRRREMNLRVALGATTAQVFGLVIRQVSVPLVTGVAAGVVAAVAAGKLVASLLFETSARDPRVIALMAGVVALVGAGATVIAITQGLTLNPADALRDE